MHLVSSIFIDYMVSGLLLITYIPPFPLPSLSFWFLYAFILVYCTYGHIHICVYNPFTLQSTPLYAEMIKWCLLYLYMSNICINVQKTLKRVYIIEILT
jgi:hypothetical protein